MFSHNASRLVAALNVLVAILGNSVRYDGELVDFLCMKFHGFQGNSKRKGRMRNPLMWMWTSKPRLLLALWVLTWKNLTATAGRAMAHKDFCTLCSFVLSSTYAAKTYSIEPCFRCHVCSCKERNMFPFLACAGDWKKSSLHESWTNADCHVVGDQDHWHAKCYYELPDPYSHWAQDACCRVSYSSRDDVSFLFHDYLLHAQQSCICKLTSTATVLCVDHRPKLATQLWHASYLSHGHILPNVCCSAL